MSPRAKPCLSIPVIFQNSFFHIKIFSKSRIENWKMAKKCFICFRIDVNLDKYNISTLKTIMKWFELQETLLKNFIFFCLGPPYENFCKIFLSSIDLKVGPNTKSTMGNSKIKLLLLTFDLNIPKIRNFQIIPQFSCKGCYG